MSKHSALNTFGRSGNPAFTRNFDDTGAVPQSERMTLDGAVNKTAILLSLCFGGAFIGWNVPALAMPGLIIGTILAFVTIFRNPAKAGTTAPFYAGFEGRKGTDLTSTSDSPIITAHTEKYVTIECLLFS